MKIKLEVTPDYIGQVIGDLEYIRNLSNGTEETAGGADILSPYTVKLLQGILAAAEERAAAMVQEGSEISEIFNEQAGQAGRIAGSGGSGGEQGGSDGD